MGYQKTYVIIRETASENNKLIQIKYKYTNYLDFYEFYQNSNFNVHKKNDYILNIFNIL